MINKRKEVIAIPGTTRINHIEENVKAAEIEFTDDELNQLNDIFPKDAAKGTRYPEQAMKTVNV